MKLYVKTQGRIVGPLDWDRILVLHDHGRLSKDATVSEDNTTWLTIEQVRQLIKQSSNEPVNSHSLPIDGTLPLRPSGFQQAEEDLQEGYMPPQQPGVQQPQQSGYYTPPQQPGVQQPQQSGYYTPPQQPGVQYSQQVGYIPQQQADMQQVQQGGYMPPTNVQQNSMGQPMMNQYQTVPSSTNNKNKSTVALVCGIISLIAWILPIFGLPLSIIGLIFGCKNKFMPGIILNIIGLALAIINATVGAVLGAQGKLF